MNGVNVSLAAGEIELSFLWDVYIGEQLGAAWVQPLCWG